MENNQRNTNIVHLEITIRFQHNKSNLLLPELDTVIVTCRSNNNNMNGIDNDILVNTVLKECEAQPSISNVCRGVFVHHTK